MRQGSEISAEVRKKLDTPIRATILEDIYYSRYMREEGFISIRDRAYERVRDIFRAEETPRSVWNNLVLQKPHFCGKNHESPLGIAFIECDHHNNPLCGHPEETQFFHGLGVTTYIASRLDKTLTHPKRVLQIGLNRLDRLAQQEYGTGLGTANMLPIEEIRQAKKYMTAQENTFWEKELRPHMMRVSEILRKVA